MNIIRLSFLVMYILSGFATAAPILRNASPLCASIHTEVPTYSLSASDVDDNGVTIFGDITGPIKSVTVSYSSLSNLYRKFSFDQNGRLTEFANQHGKRSDWTIERYEYDDQGRLSKVTFNTYNKKGILKPFREDTYTYLDQKNMVVLTKRNLDERKWIGTVAAVTETDPNGQNVCYLMAAAPSYTSGKKYVSRSNEILYLEHPSYPAPYPVTKSEEDADSVLLSVLTDLKSAHEDSCSSFYSHDHSTSRWDCSADKTSMDNGLIKSISAPVGSGWEWGAITWYYKNGAIAEHVKNFDDKLSNGQFPHDIYKYQVDNHENWIEEKHYRETSPGLTNDNPKLKLIETTTRDIEYYADASAKTH